jgi:hypothetical protein
MLPSLRTACRIAGLGLVLGLPARAATPLASSSPFLPAGSAGTAATENTPLELRGILVDDGGYRFSVFDPVRHTGTWVRLNEPGYDFVIRTHDEARDTITLSYQGRILTLPLHTAKVVAAAGVEAVADLRPAGAPGPTGAKLTPAEENARINLVREEIARRRALRMQVGGPPAPAAK